MSLLSRVVQRPRLVLRNFAGQECCGSRRLISRHLNKSEDWGVVVIFVLGGSAKILAGASTGVSAFWIRATNQGWCSLALLCQQSPLRSRDECV
jgi:hypothetical protein